MRQIDIEWVQFNRKVTANLRSDANQQMIDLMWANLPYNSAQNHALVSGDHLYHLLPLPEMTYTPVDDVVPDRTKTPDGTVFLSHLIHMAIKYGELTEYIPAAPVGNVIPEHISILKDVGNMLWNEICGEKRPLEVRVTRHGEQWKPRPLFDSPPTGSDVVDALLAKINRATEEIWIQPSDELIAIHSGKAPSGAGSHGQYFSTMVFVNGEVRPLGHCAFGGLQKAAALNKTDLESLKRITPLFCAQTVEFLEYCGLHKLHALTTEFLKSLEKVETMDQFLALVSAMSLYANQLNVWNLHYFPWHHGERDHRHPHARNSETRGLKADAASARAV